MLLLLPRSQPLQVVVEFFREHGDVHVVGVDVPGSGEPADLHRVAELHELVTHLAVVEDDEGGRLVDVDVVVLGGFVEDTHPAVRLGDEDFTVPEVQREVWQGHRPSS